MELVSAKIFLIFTLFVHYNAVSYAFPQPASNPNLEYELISGGPQVGPKPTLAPHTTAKNTQAIRTPPPPPHDTKSFIYDPISKQWTAVKNNDAIPAKDALLWNQSNDKFLTQIPQA